MRAATMLPLCVLLPIAVLANTAPSGRTCSDGTPPCAFRLHVGTLVECAMHMHTVVLRMAGNNEKIMGYVHNRTHPSSLAS